MRSTRPDAAGNFRIPYLRPGNYTLVIQSDGHATGVVTGVTVAAGATTVSTAASAIPLPTSAMADITGSASQAAPDTGASSVLPDGEVRASQSLTGGESIEVRSTQLDSVLGTYRLSVPKAAAVKATYGASGTLPFVPDALDAGSYRIDVLMRDDPDMGE